MLLKCLYVVVFTAKDLADGTKRILTDARYENRLSDLELPAILFLSLSHTLSLFPVVVLF